jgi:hypothetical protein
MMQQISNITAALFYDVPICTRHIQLLFQKKKEEKRKSPGHQSLVFFFLIIDKLEQSG